MFNRTESAARQSVLGMCVRVRVCVCVCVDLEVRQFRRNRLYAPISKLLRGQESHKCVKHHDNLTSLNVNFTTGCKKKKQTSHTCKQIIQYGRL